MIDRTGKEKRSGCALAQSHSTEILPILRSACMQHCNSQRWIPPLIHDLVWQLLLIEWGMLTRRSMILDGDVDG